MEDLMSRAVALFIGGALGAVLFTGPAFAQVAQLPAPAESVALAAPASTPSFVPGARIRVTTVDLREIVGRLVGADVDGVELEVTDGKRKGARETVVLRDIKDIEVSRGKAGRAWSAVRGTLGGATGTALLFAPWGAVAYDDDDLQYGSAAEGAFYGAATGALVGGAIGAVVGAGWRIERWAPVPGTQYRHGVTPRPPVVPYRHASIRGGWNGQYRWDATDPADVEGLAGGSMAQGFTLGIKADESTRLEFEVWRPARVVVPADSSPAGVTRSFRDTVLSLTTLTDFATTARVRPYTVFGISFMRVDEQALATRRNSYGFVAGIGTEVSVGRHLAIAPELRMNFPWEFLLLGLPYTGGEDVSVRTALRPSVAAVVRF
jgi:hypothetical protein